MFQASSTAIVQGTLYVLIAFSVLTWTVILIKGIQQLRQARENRVYHRRFWSAESLEAAAGVGAALGPVARVAQAGFTALATGATTRDLEHSGDRRDLLERCLRQQLHKERRAMESGLALLASIGSTSPFVGLFGTVWGIMHALQDITHTGSASLDVVAGPIGEALIATAIGIAAAIPAVLAYNFFVRRVKLAAADLEDFATDFLNLALKSGLQLRRSVPATEA